MNNRIYRKVVICFLVLLVCTNVSYSADFVITLGTGVPIPQPKKRGSATLVVVNNQPYLFDAGVGVQDQFIAAMKKYPEYASFISPERVRQVFLTHLHSDHTLGLDEMIYGVWAGNARSEKLDIYGPEQTDELVSGLHYAFRADKDLRLYGLEPVTVDGWMTNVKVTPATGQVYKDDNVTVTAFPVKHGTWPDPRGYLVKTDKGHLIVISGDNREPELLVPYAKVADVVISEVYTLSNFDDNFPKESEETKEFWTEYFNSFHTSTKQLAEAMKKAKPKLLVTTHQITGQTTGKVASALITKEMRLYGYDGPLINAQDLTLIEIPHSSPN
ncbi:MBL fold metallo-hydrolase [Halodesulfovibrio marinisediminis]|uniref:Ribonuclease BN, tRNA processing enzyme n=1 Tax=Halodesulfovibrio marinisediminis DSM 17456 TaxID=1121457 RepID=A0A1N6DXR3_9BACT|nr:MBL fold metallo-hydrolase [Halodesulfovibrio marinisediminis]SIN75578.1 Ribonuclease BN, tRNA processing enzyme [Halodesulfovibrio marinisediminis DSM 17456]